MKQINKDELKNISGGGFSIGYAAAIAAAVTFMIGVFDGYTRKLACH